METVYSCSLCKWYRAVFCYSNPSIRRSPTVIVNLLAGRYAQAVGIHTQRDTKRQTTMSVESTNIASQLIGFFTQLYVHLTVHSLRSVQNVYPTAARKCMVNSKICIH